jgi:Transcriptional regulators
MVNEMNSYISDGKIQNLNKSEYAVYNYCMMNLQLIPNTSIQELADYTFVSKTTIVRMCKKIGFEGFSEFRFFLKSIIDEQRVRTNISINDIQKIRTHDINTTLSNINFEKLKDTVTKIKDKRITFFGKGLSHLICDYAKIQLTLLGVDISSYDNETHIANRQAKKMTDQDVLILISASGTTRQCVELANIVKNTDALIISLTDTSMNPLADIADISWRIVMTPDPRVDFDNKSRIPLFIFIQHLIDLFIEEFK